MSTRRSKITIIVLALVAAVLALPRAPRTIVMTVVPPQPTPVVTAVSALEKRLEPTPMFAAPQTTDLDAYFPRTKTGELELSWIKLAAAHRTKDRSRDLDEKSEDEFQTQASILWQAIHSQGAEAVDTAIKAFEAMPDDLFEDRFQVLSVPGLMAGEFNRAEALRQVLLRESRKDYRRGLQFDDVTEAPLLRGLSMYLMIDTDAKRRDELLADVASRQSDPAVLERLDWLATTRR